MWNAPATHGTRGSQQLAVFLCLILSLSQLYTSPVAILSCRLAQSKQQNKYICGPNQFDFMLMCLILVILGIMGEKGPKNVCFLVNESCPDFEYFT